MADGGDLRQAGLLIGVVHLALGVVAVVGVCLLAMGFLRTARAAAGAPR